MRATSPPRLHGGAIALELAALGVDPASLLDVSTSVNPYGPAPSVERAIRAAVLDRYPDPISSDARVALARLCATSVARVVVGNGASELLWTLARLLLAPGDTMLSCEPTFSEMAAAARAAGARVVELRALPDDDFAIDLAAVAQRARASGARVVSLCLPASPSGVALPAADVARLARALDDVTLVVDQSFLASSERHADLAHALPDNAVCVRSLTKEHAIPGVRVGYLLAEPRLAAAVEASRPAWTVGAAAQAAVVATCEAQEFVATTRERLLGERRALCAALQAVGHRPHPTSTSYFVLPVGDAAAVRRALVTRDGVLVRDCTSFGLPGHVRLAARGGDEAARIVAAFARVAPAERCRVASA